MTHTLRIHLFGPFEVLRDGQPLTNQDWQSQQTRAVSKVLFARRGQFVSSDQLIDIFWPHDPPDAARRRLYVRISQLRTALGAAKTMLQTVDGGYLFNPDERCWLDVEQFQDGIAQARNILDLGQPLQAIEAYENTRDIYRGDFLVEDLYADWTFADREYYREQSLTLLTELSESYALQGRYRLAIARCREALTRDPARETIYVRLMLYHYYAGERSQALQVFERCRQVLADELDVEPLASTVELAGKIRAGTLWADSDAQRYPPPIYEGRLYEVPYSLSETPFTGREREYAWLIEHWQNADRPVLFVEGEAGIGKSRLVDEFAGYILTHGATVLRTRVSPREQSAYEPVAAALRPLMTRDNLTRLTPPTLSLLSAIFPYIRSRVESLPELPQMTPEVRAQRIHDAVDAMAAACIPQNTLLLVDDAHRLSDAACELLEYFVPSLKLLLSFRHEETPASHPVRIRFQESGLAARLRLQPLNPASVDALLRQLTHNDLPEIAGRIRTLAGGNPLFIIALLQHMFEEGQLYIDASGAWGMTVEAEISAPPTIQQIIEVRLLRLNRSQRRVMDLAAVLGGEFDFDLLQHASRQPEEALLTLLDELIDVALIVEPRSSGQTEFRIAHDRYTEVAYSTLPGVRRKQYHRQAASALETVYADSLEAYYPALADHFSQAGDPGSECRYAVLAGEAAAAQFANHEALRYLGRALELTPPQDYAGRYRILRGVEGIHDVLGDRPGQKVDLDALSALTPHLDARQQAELAWRTAVYDWNIEDTDSARAATEDTIRLAQACQAADLEAAALLLRGKGNYDQAAARRDLERARELACQAGMRALEGDIVRALGNACFWQNRYDESRAYFEDALVIHQEVGDLRGELSVNNNIGMLHQLLGDPQASIQSFERGLTLCDRVGDRLAEGVLLANLGEMTTQLGDLAAAKDWLEQARIIRKETRNEEGVGYVSKRLSDVLRQQGKFVAARVDAEKALQTSLSIGHLEQQGEALEALGVIERELGNYPAAQAYFEQALELLKEFQSPYTGRAMAHHSLLYHLIGDDAAAVDLGRQAFAISEEHPQIRANALTNWGHALASLDRPDEAEAHYRTALELRRELMQSHLAAEPLAGLTRLSLHRGDTKAAIVFVEEILSQINAGGLDGVDQLSLTYLTCWRVLTACRDQRASGVVQSAYARLMARCEGIDGEENRQRYLQTVAANREIVSLYQQLQKSQ